MTKSLSVNMDEDLYRAFTVKCAEEDITKSDVVRDCVSDWLDDE